MEHGIADNIRRLARERPGAAALVFEGRVTDYAAFDRHCSQVANGLIAAGLAPGDRVAFLGRNSDHYFEFWFGAAKAGLVTVPVNWRLAPPEVAYILGDCAPGFVLADPEFLDRAPGARSTADFAAWRDAQSDADPRRDGGWQDPVLQLYTSGTTGNPKGAMLSNRSLMGLRAATPVQPDWNRWSDSDVSLVAMPAFHISGSGWGLWTLQHGATGVVVREFDPAQVIRLLVEHRITKIMMVPTALRFVCEHPDAEGADFGFLNYIGYGGAPIAPDLLRRAIAVFGCGFVQYYGMTETAGTIVALPPEDHDPAGNERMLGVGRPLPGVEIKVVDGDGRELPRGEIGEFVTRSTANMAGYFGRPEATAEAIDGDGWLRTGDAGRMDEDGYLYLADRIKDMIITGGENVYPAEVEHALIAHPRVKDVGVIGVPDARWGEAVKAVVVPEGDPPDPAELIAWARERIAAYKAPKSIDYREALPRNPSGKILRRVLRDEYR